MRLPLHKVNIFLAHQQVREFSTKLHFLTKNQLFDDTTSNSKKQIVPDNNLVRLMENSIKQAYTYSKLKKEKDLKDCLLDLKNYSLQLDEKTERRLNESAWNYLIQHFAKREEFEELAIHWYRKIMIEKKIANPSSFTFGTMLKLFSDRGEVEQCEQIFEKLRERKEYSLFTYTQYVNACIKRNDLEKSFSLILDMKRNNIEPSYGIFIPMLKAATATNNVHIGLKMLELIDISNTTAIQVSMCVIKFALQAKLPEKVIGECEKLKKHKLMTIVTWSCLMQAYIQMNQVEKAIKLIDEIEKEDIKLDSPVFTILITACANGNLLEKGEYLYRIALKKIIPNTELFTCIINMYVKCNRPEKAIEIFQEMKNLKLMNVVTWSCLMQAYIQMNQVEKAIKLIDEMKKHEVDPNSATFTILITACANNNMFEQGEYLHNFALRILDRFSVELTTSIINFYTKCNRPEKAIEECKALKQQKLMNTVSWNCLIQAYIQMNEIEKAIQLLDEMNDIQPDSITFIILITACANNNMFEQGEYLHNLALRTLDRFSVELTTSIINFYTKCNRPEKVVEIFQEMKNRKLMTDVVWSCLMQAYIQMNQLEKAIQLIDEMEKYGYTLNYTVFITLLTACTKNSLIELGEYLHRFVLRKMAPNIEVINAIINMYVKCNRPEKAVEIFQEMKNLKLMNVVTWSCLMQAYIQMNQVEKSVQLLDDMTNEGILPDSTMFTILITACANNNMFEQGEYLHNLALRVLDNFTIEFWNTILNFYTKCNRPEKAIEEGIRLRETGLMNIVTWNCLISAYIQAADITMAMELFQQMKLKNVEPDVITFIILLSGLGEFVSQEKGLSIIQEIKHRDMDSTEEIISSMINFYSKIGEKLIVSKLIKKLEKKDVTLSIITYNNILSHYAHHGNGILAKKLFDKMVKRNVRPNDQTFTIILNAFSHSGMTTEALNFFNDLQLIYNHKPSVFNIGAMIDVYSRAGLLDQAESLIGDEMNVIWWTTLMGGCRKFNNIEVGERVFNKLIRLAPQESSPYILISNIYTYYGLNEKAEMIRNLMEKNGIKKIPGIVYHEENGHTYKFISGSTDYERYEEVEKMRDDIYRKIIKAGFKPDTKWVTYTKQLTEQEKVDALCKHAEKTAIAHALVLNPKRKKILLTKNLRVCNDCHNATEFISKAFDIEIIVRDANRYHHFVNGKCSCNNYW